MMRWTLCLLKGSFSQIACHWGGVTVVVCETQCRCIGCPLLVTYAAAPVGHRSPVACGGAVAGLRRSTLHYYGGTPARQSPADMAGQSAGKGEWARSGQRVPPSWYPARRPPLVLGRAPAKLCWRRLHEGLTAPQGQQRRTWSSWPPTNQRHYISMENADGNTPVLYRNYIRH